MKFTPVQIVMMLAAAVVTVTLVVVLIVKLFEQPDNGPVLVQVQAYISGLEISYKKTYKNYPAIYDNEGFARTNLDQYGCLVSTANIDTCIFDGKEQEMFPDKKGVTRLDSYVPLLPLKEAVVDHDGDIFDSVMYSSNGTKYRLRYPLWGDDVDCGINNAFEIFAGSKDFEGVTICVYESR